MRIGCVQGIGRGLRLNMDATLSHLTVSRSSVGRCLLVYIIQEDEGG